MTPEELAQRAYTEVYDEDWQEAQNAQTLPPDFVKWELLNPTKRYELLEIAEKGGDSSRFGRKVSEILERKAKFEAATLLETTDAPAEPAEAEAETPAAEEPAENTETDGEKPEASEAPEAPAAETETLEAPAEASTAPEAPATPKKKAGKKVQTDD